VADQSEFWNVVASIGARHELICDREGVRLDSPGTDWSSLSSQALPEQQSCVEIARPYGADRFKPVMDELPHRFRIAQWEIACSRLFRVLRIRCRVFSYFLFLHITPV